MNTDVCCMCYRLLTIKLPRKKVIFKTPGSRVYHYTVKYMSYMYELQVLFLVSHRNKFRKYMYYILHLSIL